MSTFKNNKKQRINPTAAPVWRTKKIVLQIHKPFARHSLPAV
jgi:hypothetical protein